MKLIIDIPDEIYNDVKTETYFDAHEMCDVKESIKNGIPLQKGHGDLIDRRELKKEVYTATEWNGDIHRIIYEASVDDAPTIIEAE